MLTKIKNEFIYADLRKQVVLFIISIFVIGSVFYYVFINGLSSELNQEIAIYQDAKKMDKNIDQLLMTQQNNEWYINDQDLMNLVKIYAKELRLSIHAYPLGQGQMKVILSGYFNQIGEFINKIDNFNKPIAIETLAMEKKNKINAEIFLIYLEDAQDD